MSTEHAREISVLLHNIRSAHNVGSVFRTSDGAGVGHIYLTGYTPRPIDRFGRPQKDIKKTALGAEITVPWSSHAGSPKKLISELKAEGWIVIGVEQDERAVDYRSIQAFPRTLVLFGNEVRGLSHQLRGLCDHIVQIPMRGKKESLNVSVAAGIALYTLTNS